ncbi:conserved hypothetical protein [Neospora caninum Liverpool]|uniref:Uncharacterized protein n=1 Tax=Neospora caninum (strain Liverpool) TaxID=572307 RepID=F0VNZ1_NEOCL|nr:conserved hypothetical protein [Neospora caninum Liverpool]CBZ55437.1 conserved hypothetical protein [Neospora caninum Liverpool]CEL70173.1 TPA: hypothetical protein BN1204_058600 [Neospora caninum Liverpool]|eukprot:XP_003885465.1 conserved hypothetical protein [Neospora caninum Liverpool]
MDVAGEGFVPHLESAQGHSTTELAEPSAPSESSATSPLPPNSSMSFGDQETVTAAPNDEFDSVRAENVGPVDVNENQMSGDVSQEVLPAEPQQAKDDANPSVKVLPEEALNSEKENERLQVDPEGNGVLDSRLDDAAQTDSEGDREVDSPALIEIGDDKDRDGAPGEGGDRLPSTTENSRKEVDPLKENSAAFEEEEKTQKQLDTEKEADQAEVSPANPEASPSMTPPAAEPSTAETGGTPETAETHEKMVNGRAPSSSGDSDTPVPEPAEESEKAYEPGVVSVNAYPSSVSGAASDGDLNRDQHGTVVSSSELPQSSTSFEDADLDGEVPTSRHAGEGIAAVPSFTDGHSHTPHSSDTASGLLEPIPLSHQDMEVVNEVRESHQLAHIVDDAERGILADHQLQNGSTALLGVLPEAGASHEPVHHGEHSFALEGSVFAERPETHGVPHTGPLEYSHGMIPTSTAHEVPVGVIVHGGVTSAPGPAQTHLLPPMAAAMHAIQSPFLSHETNTAYSAPMHAKSAAGKYVTVPAAPTTLVKSDEVVASSRGGKKKGGKNKKNSSAVVYEASPGPLIPEQKTTMYVAEPTYLEVQEKPKKRSRRVPM